MESLWSKTVELPHRSPLEGDRKTEVVIIGGGMAGILTAFRLKQNGVQALVLEERRMASGQTQNTTAKITSQHGLIYHKLAETLGDELAGQYAGANQKAIQDYQEIISSEGIDCGFEMKPAFLYSLAEEEPLLREAETAARFGIQASYTNETELPFSVKGAVRFENQAQFHPLEFLKGISKGVELCEETKVLSVEGNTVRTVRGTVTAQAVVFAVHYPFPNIPGYYFLRMHQERSYVLALKNAMQLNGMYLGIDQNDGWSLRNAGDHLLFGGGTHRTGENRAGGKYRRLREKAKELWPDCYETACWSAQDCMTLDSVPYIGQFSESMPSWYVATGFQKWGMTSSMVAADLIAGQILGRCNPFAEVFSPQRFTPGASAKTFLQEGMHAARGLSRSAFEPPRAELDAMPEGHGGILEVNGEKVGVYKEKGGRVYTVSIQCPHLGCQLEWNPDEKSWDCPCHGSRFDYRGKRLDNPAQEDLEDENFTEQG